MALVPGLSPGHMQRPHTSVFFCNLSGFPYGLRQAGLCHLPRDVGEDRSGESVFLCHLLRHTCILARVENQVRSIQTGISGSAPT